MSLCEFEDQKWKLTYKASVDGFKAKDFHQKCDGKSNTIIIIKDVNANIFGGFTGASWSEYDGFKEDPYAFIFSFSNNQNEKALIRVSEPAEAIYCHKDCGPSFGNDDIKISNMSNCNQKSISNVGYSYGDSMFEFGSDDCKNFLAGAESFQTEDIEVYCKEYNNLTQVRKYINNNENLVFTVILNSIFHFYKKDELNKFKASFKKDESTIHQAYETFHVTY